MKAFFDSSALIEFIKGNKKAVALFYELSKMDVESYINDIVFSEFIFHYISLTSGTSAINVKKKGKIDTFIKENQPRDFLDQFKILSVNESIVERTYGYMRRYNLLPNDALILATCRFHRIENLVSFDDDFRAACEKEGIKLIDTIEKLK